MIEIRKFAHKFAAPLTKSGNHMVKRIKKGKNRIS